jgi:hypothetical protein
VEIELGLDDILSGMFQGPEERIPKKRTVLDFYQYQDGAVEKAERAYL